MIIKFKQTSLVLLLTVSLIGQTTGSVFADGDPADDNQGYINQGGYSDQGYINQTGSSNQGYIGQIGSSDEGYINQAGFSNQGYIGQVGSSDQGYINQNGYSDQGYINQAGYSDQGYINQSGYSDAGYINQNGYSDAGYINQNGYSDAGYINQNGYSDSGYINQNGYSDNGYGVYTSSVINTGYTTTPYTTGSYGSYSYPSYISGSYGSSYSYPSYISSNVNYIGGGTVGTNTSCPTGTTRVGNTCQPPVTCSNGSTLVNGSCVANNTWLISTSPCSTWAGRSSSLIVSGPNPLPANYTNGYISYQYDSTNINNIRNINTSGCSAPTTPAACPTGTTLVNGTCQYPNGSCPAGTTLTNGVCQPATGNCPTGTTLVNGTCQYPNGSCPTGMTLVNGSCQYPNSNCPSGTTLINGTCQLPTSGCPSGTTLINGTCQLPVGGCPSGTFLSNGVCTPSVSNTYTCSNGTIVAFAYQCPQIYTNSNYGYVNYGYSTPTISYQTCWDGSTIPNSSICPSQYKVCANGTNIPINQTCYSNLSPVYVPPQTVKFNNVVTSVATQITNTSGRCNGIGLIANGAPSTGWFEYGETANLGRTTAQAQIGSASTAPFSNVLASLKPTTRYYCRAVMQNQYGVVKGEIVSFTTKAKAVTYVKPIVTPVKTVKKPVKNEVICSDGSSVTVKSTSVSTLINQGEKLISLSVEKGEGKMVADAVVGYKVSYKNLSDTRLTGVIFKVTLPEEIAFVGSSIGTYDPATRVLTLNQDTLDPYAEGMILVTGKITKDAPIGKSIVTNVYAAYTVPSTNTQDEVTAYVVGSIVPATDMTKVDTGAKHVVGTSDKGFLPSTLIEWLALIAILFIIFILGRSVYASYKDEEAGAHH